MRGDNYLETTSLLDMARSMCESLQKGEKLLTPGYRILNEELETLLRLFHHHHGVIGLHTNRPKQSLTHFIQLTDMLQKKLGGNKTQGGNDQSLGVAWNELGNAYLQNDAYAEAEDCFLKSIHALRSLTNSTKISINMPLINLAFCHWLQGDLDKSESVFQESLEDREREYGVNDTTSLM
jgi:tetratricopeptide (TPR) repeat protein